MNSDELVIKLRDIALSAISAASVSDEGSVVIERLEELGYRVNVRVEVCIRPDIIPVVQITPTVVQGDEMIQRRCCPVCTTNLNNKVWMKRTEVTERISGNKEREVLKGAQVRYVCSVCGYGEVESKEK